MDSDGRRVLAVGAHPDDVEIMCAGTLFLLRELGYELHVATLTEGDCGSEDQPAVAIARIRRAEAAAAAGVLGAEYHCAGFHDLSIFNDDESNRRVTALVREVDAAMVFTHPPGDYMSDHEIASLLVRNACFAASARNYDTSGYTDVARSHSIPRLYYAQPLGGIDIFGKPVVPQFYVDVSSSIEKKLDMLSRHESQRAWLRTHHGIDNYIESVREWSEQLANAATLASGRTLKYAEGFRQHRGHSYPSENLLAALLGEAVISEPSY